ncbi:MAG: hypothetical protein ABJH28_08175 [Paraglaciecola sp.]|uniref:hypothetical protein n=1 Tax=Paraglaciecola sp. TaxID=1920173 RepID=UPI0032657DC9
MKTNSLLLLPLAALGLSACVFEQKVGGPCSYSVAFGNAKVTAIYPNYSVLTSEGLEYQVPIKLFTLAPQLEHEYKITFEKITKGSCTPVVVKAVELIST